MYIFSLPKDAVQNTLCGMRYQHAPNKFSSDVVNPLNTAAIFYHSLNYKMSVQIALLSIYWIHLVMLVTLSHVIRVVILKRKHIMGKLRAFAI